MQRLWMVSMNGLLTSCASVTDVNHGEIMSKESEWGCVKISRLTQLKKKTLQPDLTSVFHTTPPPSLIDLCGQALF